MISILVKGCFGPVEAWAGEEEGEADSCISVCQSAAPVPEIAANRSRYEPVQPIPSEGHGSHGWDPEQQPGLFL